MGLHEIREERVDGGGPARETYVSGGTAPVRPATSPAYTTRTIYPLGWRSIQAVWFVAGVVNAILVMDFAFRLLKANATGFVDFIYGIADVFGSPFDGIFRQTLARGSFVVRWADLLAVGIYSLVAYGIAKLIRITAARPARPLPPGY